MWNKESDISHITNEEADGNLVTKSNYWFIIGYQ